MRYVAETGNVKFYNGDKLIAESHDCFSHEIKPVTITRHDIDIAIKITPHYEVKQDAESGRWYLYDNYMRICEIFHKTEK